MIRSLHLARRPPVLAPEVVVAGCRCQRRCVWCWCSNGHNLLTSAQQHVGEAGQNVHSNPSIGGVKFGVKYYNTTHNVKLLFSLFFFPFFLLWAPETHTHTHTHNVIPMHLSIRCVDAAAFVAAASLAIYANREGASAQGEARLDATRAPRMIRATCAC